MEPVRKPPLRFGVFEVDPMSGDLRRHGLKVRLHEKSFQILMALLERPGEVVTRQELQRRLWPEDTFVAFDNNLNNAVSRLREALRDPAASPQLIETLPRRGYRFLATVAPLAPASLPPRDRGDVRAASETIRSIAVLPLTYAGPAGQADQEYLADGMTSILITELAKHGVPKVISETSVMQYRGTKKSLPAIARDLGVDTVLEGSMFREGNTLRINVQLIDARSDTHLWANSYQRDTHSILALQDEIAGAVVREMNLTLGPRGRASSAAPRKVNPEVHEAYLKGEYFLHKTGQEARERALVYFQQALALDKTFAPAHAGVANYYILSDSLPPQFANPRARASAQKALELDDTLAHAHVSLAYVYYYADWDCRGAEREFQRAIELNPSHALARRWYARYLGTMGRHDQALAQMHRALDLDPLSIATRDSAAMVWSYARQPANVTEQGRKILELDPSDARGYEHVAVGCIHAGLHEQAHAAVQKGLALLPRDPLFMCFLAIAQSGSGRTTEAGDTLRTLERMTREGYVSETWVAVALAQTGRSEHAFTWLQRGYDQRDPYLVLLNASPWFDPLRSDHRFQNLLRRMDFPEHSSLKHTDADPRCS